MQGQTIITTHDVDELFISTVIRLIQRRAFPNLRNIIAKTHSADIARWFPHLRPEAKVNLFKVLIEEKRMGEVLRDLNSADISEFVEETDPPVVASILHTVPADDVTRILSDLPAEKKGKLLNLIEGATSEDVERLLEYEEKTAGSIMTPQAHCSARLMAFYSAVSQAFFRTFERMHGNYRSLLRSLFL
ncbi:MAG: hypothetical protein OXI61_06880 [Candidatus Poribacteria bacterium]|nr:hypothetical protein [Candidatus Poribacteria bacterium]